MGKQLIAHPFPRQFEAYQYLHDLVTMFLLYGGGAEGGKSWLGCEWLLFNCYGYPGSRWFIGRKQLKRLMSTTYITWLKVCSFYNIPQSDWHLNGQYNYIEFIAGRAKGSRIDLLDLAYQPTDPLFERLGSLEVTGGWIEEAGEIEFMCFDVLKSRVGRWKNEEFGLMAKILLTCNPTKNWLYRIFYKPWKDGVLAGVYAFVRSLYKDNPHTRESAEKRLNQITDRILRARLKEGFWEYTESDMDLMSYDTIVDLFTNVVESSEEKFITADIARFGSDKIVIGLWNGYFLSKIVEKQKQDTSRTARDIRDIAVDNGVPYSHIIVDEEGVGGGVVDQLPGCVGFVAGSAALPNVVTKKKENYKNLRAQVSFMFAEKANNHGIAISPNLSEKQKEMIVEDLQQLRRVDTAADAPLQIISKDEMKASIMRSPDYGDMIVMRMALTLKKKPRYSQYEGAGGVQGFIPGVG
jgi:hypothetical protein